MLDYCLSHLPVLVLLALFVATLFAAARNLAMQNVFGATCVIVLVSGFFELLNAKTGIPCGRYSYADDWHIELFHVALWVVIIFNSRALARLTVRPWRDQPHYGYWVMGLTCLIVILMNMAMEAIAFAEHRWQWNDYKDALNWYGDPWINCATKGAITLLILIFILPWLIDKKSGNRQ